MLPVTPVDFVGDDQQHALSDILGITECKWFSVSGVQVIGQPIARVGDSTIEVSAGGIRIDSGFTVTFPPIALPMSFYDLTKWYIILAADDVAAVGAGI